LGTREEIGIVGLIHFSVVLAILAITPTEPAFSDVSPADWFYEVVSTAVGKGIVGGYADGTFRPYSNVTRGQLSKIIALARRWPLLDPVEPHFSDVERGSTFYSFIETAQYHGVVSGYGDGTFRENANATRGQLAKMLYVALTQASGP
jgi:5'-nucleotidase/2',3'-cyclic-nucleotide 2'-phosphodiesterase/3'-nucleotidase/5'-nucleotidase